MAAVRARLDPKALPSSNQRVALRRKLRLVSQGAAATGDTEVMILDLSTTGLLLETAGDLTKGETIELVIAEAVGVRAVIKWSSGQLFGCEFWEPITLAAVGAALLRAPHEAPSPIVEHALPHLADFAGDRSEEPCAEKELSFSAKIRWILGLALLSWSIIFAVALLAWRSLH